MLVMLCMARRMLCELSEVVILHTPYDMICMYANVSIIGDLTYVVLGLTVAQV